MLRFPWGDMHSLNLGWFLQKFNELREDWATAEAGIDGALDAEIQKAEDALSDVFDARDAAAASATAAAGSASAARTSATAAQNSATAAANSATLANNKATAAGLSEAAAAQSATQAGQSATAAAGSATAAGNSATAAAGSATAAAASAASIEGDAAAAAASAAAAADSATQAETAADSVEQSAAQIQQNSDDILSIRNILPTPFLPITKFRKLPYNSQNITSVVSKQGIFEFDKPSAIEPRILLTGLETDPLTIAQNTADANSCFYLPQGTYKIKVNVIESTNLNVFLYLQPINETINVLGSTQVLGHIEKNFTVTGGLYAFFIGFRQEVQNGKLQFIIEQIPESSALTLIRDFDNSIEDTEVKAEETEEKQK